MNDEMVRSVLEGRKKRTWRPVNHPAVKNHNWHSCTELYPGEFLWTSLPVSGRFLRDVYEPGTGISCPYGNPGDRLWVRETWGYEYGGGYLYRASHEHMKDVGGLSDGKWHPSIHMPRAACRIVLQITSVHPERLFDISENDALAEGIASFRPVPGDGPSVTKYRDYMCDAKGAQGLRVQKYPFASATDSYFSLVESIYGRGFIDSNPWGWAISFRRVQQQSEPDYDNAAKDYANDILHLDQPTPYDP